MATRLTKTAWFGPRRYGWGWSPSSWQGWVVTIAFVVVSRVVLSLWPKRAAVAMVGLVAAFLGVVLVTGDPPGSRQGQPRVAAASRG